MGGAPGSPKSEIALGALLFLGLMTWNVKAITQSDNPGFRTLEGLMVVVPLFILFVSVDVLHHRRLPITHSSPKRSSQTTRSTSR